MRTIVTRQEGIDVEIKGTIAPELTKILSDAWNRNATLHENILTATWALRMIMREHK